MRRRRGSPLSACLSGVTAQHCPGLSHGKPGSAYLPAAGQELPASAGGHTGPKSYFAFPLLRGRLIGSLHSRYSRLVKTRRLPFSRALSTPGKGRKGSPSALVRAAWRPEYSRGNKRLQTQTLPSSSSFVLDSLPFECEDDDEDDNDSDISVCFIGVTQGETAEDRRLQDVSR